jgi:murein DD-endopeptidase MepM/ murein hydrolase activator NlpD
MAKYKLSDIFAGNYKVSQYFGARPWYYIRFGLAGHEGVDWATPTGVKLLIPFARGQVLRTGWDNAYGWFAVIWDPTQRCAVWYCHMSKISVRAGQSLTRGAVVGYTGATGNVSGAHLHCNFVETDTRGNRLNRFNGYQGFLNILNSNLVSWTLTR